MVAMSNLPERKYKNCIHPREQVCEVCGEKYIAFANRTKYCLKCRERAKKKSVGQKRGATTHYCDTQERIDICLNCKKAVCTGDCGDIRVTERKPRLPMAVILERRRKVKELHLAGMLAPEIATIVGVPYTMVCNDIRRMREVGELQWD